MNKIVLVLEYVPVDSGREIVVSAFRVGAAAQDGETFVFLLGLTSPRTISRQYRNIKFAARHEPTSHLIYMGLDSSKVGKEARCDHQNSNRSMPKRRIGGRVC